MPETRYITEITYPEGTSPAEKVATNPLAVITRIPYEVSDKELAEEAEEKALAKVDELIDQIDSLAKAKVFLKRLCVRLIKKGYLP